MKLVRKLDQASYPYEIVQLPYTIGDNGPPDPTLSDYVRHWNERYLTPRLILSTHEQMFHAFEARYASELPVVQGDFTPYWEDGAASTALETALNRSAVDRLVQGEVLWSMLSPEAYPAQDYRSAWRSVVFYDEHTWGAHNSTEEPDLPFVKQQWEFKREFAIEADRASRKLLSEALSAAKTTALPQNAVDVYNTSSWPRTDVVFLAPELSDAGDRIVDAEGKPVASQRLSTGELAVLARDVPPFAAKRLLVQSGNAYAESGDALTNSQGNTLSNDFLTLTMNPKTGAIDSLKPRSEEWELVDRAQGAGLDQYLYVLGTDPATARSVSNVRVKVKERGSLVVSLLVEADAPGANAFSTEVRLLAGINRVDLLTRIDKRAVREKEGVHLAFPFHVPGGQLRYDVANGVVRPEADQLAGSCKNFFSVQSWVDVSNRDYGVTWATANAPLIEIGAITAEQPWMKSIAPSSSMYSYVMNNYWHTNYKADQEGPVTFSYSLLPHAAFAASAAVKFGLERRQPLLVARANPDAQPQSSLLQLSSTEVVVSSMQPIAGGRSWLLYLYNPTMRAQNVSMRWRNGVPVSIWRSSVDGKAGAKASDLEISAFGSGYWRIDEGPGLHAGNR
jgi:alpha-mannosidase